jgi:hypothetical protein
MMLFRKKKPQAPPAPPPPPTPADPDPVDWSELVVPPPPRRARPRGPAASARLRAARLWWRPRRLP